MARLLLVLVTLLALGLRLRGLDREQLWFDEVNSLVRADAPTPAGVVANQLRDCQMPLHDLLTWVGLQLAGERLDETRARLPAALFGAALAPAAWLLAVELGAGAVAGFVAALLVATTPLLVHYGQEARPYSLFALLATLVTIAAARLLRSRGERGALLLAITAPLLLLVHPYGALLLGAVVLVLVWNLATLRARIGTVTLALLPGIAVALLWAPIALYQLRAPPTNFVYDELDLRALVLALDTWTLEGAAVATGALDRCTFVQLAMAALGAAVLAWPGSRRQRCDSIGFLEPQKPERAAVSVGRGGPEPSGFRGELDSRERRRLRAAWLALASGGALALLLAAAWPHASIERLASDVLRGGRPLDADGREYLGALRPRTAAGGGALLALALLVRALPRLARRMRERRNPGAFLLPAAILLPFAVILLLDRAGIPTFIARHSIWAAAPLAVLVAVTVAAPERRPTRALVLAGVLVAAGARGFHPIRPLRDAPDLRAAAAVLAAHPEATPLAQPDWTARCLEYYGGRPWRSIGGADDPAEARRLAAGHERIVLVISYEGFSDAASILAAFAETHRRAPLATLPGVRCELLLRR